MLWQHLALSFLWNSPIAFSKLGTNVNFVSLNYSFVAGSSLTKSRSGVQASEQIYNC